MLGLWVRWDRVRGRLAHRSVQRIPRPNHSMCNVKARLRGWCNVTVIVLRHVRSVVAMLNAGVAFVTQKYRREYGAQTSIPTHESTATGGCIACTPERP